MTHQQLIDFWAEQIKKHEHIAQNIPELAHEYKVLANQARIIYMQLVQMDCEEPIVFTSIDIPDDSFKGTVFSGLENISSVDLDPEIAKTISDNWFKLFDESPQIVAPCVIDPCQSDDPDDQCENCTCWKATRGNCS